MFQAFTGWHLMIILGVILLIAAVAAVVLWAVYAVARAGARRGAAERELRSGE